MKQNALVASIVACALAFVLAGCSSATVSSTASSKEAMPSASDQSITASEASAPASDASSSASASATWTEAKDAKTAAVSAGIGEFAVPEDDVGLSIGTVKPTNWTFRFTNGIAEADGSASAATVVVRKASKAGDCTTPLSDFVADGWSALEGMEYDHAWTQKVGDVEVTCSGNKEGVASKMIWNENQHGLSVQVLGQGDNWADFGIDEDDVEELVGAVIDANSGAGESSARQKEPTNAKDYAEALVWQNGLGELVSYRHYQDENGNWVLEVVTRGADGNEYTSIIGADGTVLESDYEQVGDGTAQEDNAADGTADNDNDGIDDGAGVQKYSNKEAKQAVEDNNLGTYMYSQEVQGSDGKIYQEITTRDENGTDSYSYLDSNGNVVYDVDVELRYNNDGSATPSR